MVICKCIWVVYNSVMHDLPILLRVYMKYLVKFVAVIAYCSIFQFNSVGATTRFASLNNQNLNISSCNIAHKNYQVFPKGWSIGGGIGYSFAQNEFPSYDHGGFSSNLSVGYEKAISRRVNLGIESDFHYGNKLASIDGDQVESVNIPLYLTVRYFLIGNGNDNVNIFAKAGYAYNRLIGGGTNYNLWRPALAAGSEYDMGNFGLFGQYQWYSLASGGHSQNQGSFTTGIIYHFGR